MKQSMKEAIQEAVPVPQHIREAAKAVRWDLLYGPSYVALPDDLTQFNVGEHLFELLTDAPPKARWTYSSSIADLLREFIQSLPTVYWDDHFEFAFLEPDLELEFSELHHRTVTEALFGPTIAKEFS